MLFLVVCRVCGLVLARWCSNHVRSEAWSWWNYLWWTNKTLERIFFGILPFSSFISPTLCRSLHFISQLWRCPYTYTYERDSGAELTTHAAANFELCSYISVSSTSSSAAVIVQNECHVFGRKNNWKMREMWAKNWLISRDRFTHLTNRPGWSSWSSTGLRWS